MIKNEAFDYLNSCAQVTFESKKLERMLSSNIDLVNLPSEEGETCLHQAAAWYLPEAVKILISYGADVNARAKNGKTPLMEAATINSIYGCDDGALECVKILIENGADKKLRCDKGFTAIDYSKEIQFDRSIYFFLIGRGDDLDDFESYKPGLIGCSVVVETKSTTDFVYTHSGVYYEYGGAKLQGVLMRYVSGIFDSNVSSIGLASNCLLVLRMPSEADHYIHIDDVERVMISG